MSNTSNPYQTPLTHAPASDEKSQRRMRQIARQLIALRDASHPFRLMFWRGMRTRVIATLFCLGLLGWLATHGGPFSDQRFALIGVGFFIGSFARDFGLTWRVARSWPYQQGFFDWKKIEEYR